MKNIHQISSRQRRMRRVRARIYGTAARPRLTVHRTNKYIYAQLINDDAAMTIAHTSDVSGIKGTKNQRSQAVGAAIAKLATEKGIKAVVFDRGPFAFHGRIKALAQAARDAGLLF